MFNTNSNFECHQLSHRNCTICKGLFSSIEMLELHQKQVCFQALIANPPNVKLMRADEDPELLKHYLNALKPTNEIENSQETTNNIISEETSKTSNITSEETSNSSNITSEETSTTTNIASEETSKTNNTTREEISNTNDITYEATSKTNNITSEETISSNNILSEETSKTNNITGEETIISINISSEETSNTTSEETNNTTNEEISKTNNITSEETSKTNNNIEVLCISDDDDDDVVFVQRTYEGISNKTNSKEFQYICSVFRKDRSSSGPIIKKSKFTQYTPYMTMKYNDQKEMVLQGMYPEFMNYRVPVDFIVKPASLAYISSIKRPAELKTMCSWVNEPVEKLSKNPLSPGLLVDQISDCYHQHDDSSSSECSRLSMDETSDSADDSNSSESSRLSMDGDLHSTDDSSSSSDLSRFLVKQSSSSADDSSSSEDS